MSIMTAILIFSGLPFALIQCMPGKKTFALTATLYTAFIIYGYYDVQKAEGIGGTLAYVFFCFIAYGAVAGIITKAITLYLASRNVSLPKRTAARLAGLLLVPCFIYAPAALDKWKHRAPSTACNYDIITFSIHNQKFQVPGIGIVSAMRGKGEISANDLEDYFGFQGAPSFRKFCDAFNNGQTIAEVNALSFRLNGIARERNNPRFSKLCAQAKWPAAICNYQGYASPNGYPDRIGIYDKTKFNAGFMSGGLTYERIKEEMAKATAPSDIPGFAFDGHNYFWIDKNAQSGSVPYALSCTKSNNGLYCRSDEALEGDVYITYGANVRLADPVADARNVRSATIAFIKILNIK